MRSGLPVLAAFSLFALLAGPGIPAANAQATGAAGTKAQQKSAPQAKIKEPVTAAACKPEPGKPYFVEFRSRTAASYGHTFVFFGRLGAPGKFGKFQVAGLHPKGDDPAVYIKGHMVPVPSDTGVSYGDLDEQYMTARYCVVLNEAEYNKVAAFIKKLQATSPEWHAPTKNCNSFAGDIAKSMGLKAPPSLLYPERFIKTLRDMNNGRTNLSAVAKSNIP
jgi:hypothetical protein